MEIDLFQGILLGLLALGLIVLVALLSTLGGIRKALERAPAGEAAPASVSSPPRSEPVAQADPEPAAAAAAVTPTVQATTEAEAPAQDNTQAATIRAVLSQHGVTETPSTTSATTPAVAQTPEPASVVAAHIDNDEPEEEPFQRDGRWWFKRGGELLVYNEGSAQWEPSERPTHWSTGTAAGAAPAATSAPEPAATAATTPQPVVTTSAEQDVPPARR